MTGASVIELPALKKITHADSTFWTGAVTFAYVVVLTNLNAGLQKGQAEVVSWRLNAVLGIYSHGRPLDFSFEN